MTISFHVSSDAKLLIKAGQAVDFSTPLSKKTVEKEIAIPIANLLRIPPQKIFLSLVKLVGEEVKKGELLASRKTIFGQKTYVSQYDGVIKEVNHNDGTIVLKTSQEKEGTTFCHFKGTVKEIKKNDIVIEVKTYQSFPLKEASSDFGGEIASVPDKVEGKIVVSASISPYDRSKLEVMGSRGFVTTDAADQESTLPYAVLKNKADLDELKKADFPCCIVDKKNTTIYAYAPV